eukprot:NODE_4865_length_730_cov_16.101161_g4702_i0.p1 GENE.NODE_4865_length_730_cov_16.101161_g4702_i0~~NODE_4865_length_730_cov_16.101161_g4702_i0.p1  ORF type:complete len:207 (-),score=45.17 NODE_4865_length_730_cov_16.101161_g4702_i0:110-661(-)
MFGEGVLRLAPRPFSPHSTDLDVQLTNICRQTQSSKLSTCRLLSTWGLIAEFWPRLHSVVNDALHRTCMQLPLVPGSRCELLGFDFLATTDHQLLLLEVNRGPSQFISHPQVGSAMREATHQLVANGIASLAAQLQDIAHAPHPCFGLPRPLPCGTLQWFDLNEGRCSHLFESAPPFDAQAEI